MPTKIEWCEETWNPITGCSPVSEGCQHCYARRMANRLRGRCGYPADEPFKVTFHPDRLGQPLHWHKPRRIFVCSMGDLFHEDVSDEQIMKIWCVMARNPQHTYLVLTKRPKRMANHDAFRHGLSFIWLGVTVEHPKYLHRIDDLLQIPAAVHFVSAEPMLGKLIFSPSHLAGYDYYGGHKVSASRIDWVICGGETGHGARPMHPDWARSLRDQCVAAGVPFFFKRFGDGSRLLDGRLWEEYPDG